jgi:hypothetical protein
MRSVQESPDRSVAKKSQNGEKRANPPASNMMDSRNWSLRLAYTIKRGISAIPREMKNQETYIDQSPATLGNILPMKMMPGRSAPIKTPRPYRMFHTHLLHAGTNQSIIHVLLGVLRMYVQV